MSSPPLRVFLSAEEDGTLRELIAGSESPRKAQLRAEVMRLSSRGWKVEKIAEYLKWSEETVRRTINRWKKEGVAGLRDKAKVGRPTKWKEEDLALIEKKLEEEERSYSSRQLKEILRKERKVLLSERQMRRILKKTYVWKRTRVSMKEKQNQEVKSGKKADLEMLELAAGAGEICLKYLDEAGFSLWAKEVYSWAKKGQQKRIEQPKRKGKRLNICGLLEKGKKFDYGLAFKSFQGENYLKLMGWQAEQAAERLAQKGQITVIVEDQASFHVGKKSREKFQEWSEKGLYIFLLPSYSSELNAIENEWQRLKEDELAGRMFEDEYELAMAVIEGIESRQGAKGLEVERFLFTQAVPDS